MGSSIKRHRRKQWEEFALLLKNKTRIETFNKAFNMVSAMSGLYEIEAKPIWDFLQKINPVSIVEIGRCMGGSLWMFGCACANLKKVLSIDIESYELSDPLLEEWFKYYKVDCDIKVEDSTQYQTNQMWDFVFIDGGHTGSIVKSDIKIWKIIVNILVFMILQIKDLKINIFAYIQM